MPKKKNSGHLNQDKPVTSSNNLFEGVIDAGGAASEFAEEAVEAENALDSASEDQDPERSGDDGKCSPRLSGVEPTESKAGDEGAFTLVEMPDNFTQRRLTPTSAEERRQRRQKGGRMNNTSSQQAVGPKRKGENEHDGAIEASFVEKLLENEDKLLDFVASVNRLYQEKLQKPAPFMTFVFVGFQSTGKSTIVERFLRRVINIVKQGTGTRSPLDITCIHDDTLEVPLCELSGKNLTGGHQKNLSVEQVFAQVTKHNEKLAEADKFDTEAVHLIYRARDVQNMRFVDTPGIIANQSTGTDNREDIKKILQSEMRKPHAKLCALLEPTEFSGNKVIDFLDESLGGRDNWLPKSVFLMTKFDKQLGDARTGSKANSFFSEFLDNGIAPHLVITPTLDTEKLEEAVMFEERQKLLTAADNYEQEAFRNMLVDHEQFLQQHPNDELLKGDIRRQLGFSTAKSKMRNIMLEDTARRLPEVLKEIRAELKRKIDEEKTLTEQQKFRDPQELKLIVQQVLSELAKRIHQYLDGNLDIAIKFPEKLQTLEDEINEEETSDWTERELNHHTEQEVSWREHIANFAERQSYPEYILPEKRLLGGKQYQRAFDFFCHIMIDTLPDPHRLESYVAMATGYLLGGLQRENWEHAMVQITKTCVKEVSHPGVNFFIKHVGNIFRRMFSLALDDVKVGEQFSATFKLMPSGVEKYMSQCFEGDLWVLMLDVAGKTHCALEPMYSTVDPHLPTFALHSGSRYNWQTRNSDSENLYRKDGQAGYVKVQSRKEIEDETLISTLKRRVESFVSGKGSEAKKFLTEQTQQRAVTKKGFLSDERSSMITDEESQLIIQRSFEYISSLVEFNLHVLKFQFNHYLYMGFKENMLSTFGNKLINNAPWDELVQQDDGVKERLDNLKEQIAGLRSSLQDIQRMQRRF